VLALAIVAAVVSVALALSVATAAFAARQRIVAAADAAALAAADVRLGVVAGDPCTVAERAARANGARLTSCALQGAIATVEASGELLGVPVRITSRAGPP
jgi:secretion/DNA translocation related TadE-like protein